MTSYLWNANPKKWHAASPSIDSEEALKQYICDVSQYVYWSTPNLQPKIKIGDGAYIWRTLHHTGIVACGIVAELPRQLSAFNTMDFICSKRLPAPGWDENDAPSSWKTGIKIHKTFWETPLVPVPSIRPARGTIRTLKPHEEQIIQQICSCEG